ncbi:unnamed protein product [Medioppia subpectinata]|uniref:Cyclin C-terminal domain-containing protein n=1 Tax=Medioppia subpectinata TaxID=1979941 RepID=A0A7R9KFH2_9ACAR|nr:unnamed protein product [Medioppia subpectinata]CAG2102591.1 unnamed protein product [Medioppia subpectinata]
MNQRFVTLVTSVENSSGVPQRATAGAAVEPLKHEKLQFSCQLPSLIAAASIATAVHGLQSIHKQSKSFDLFVSSLATILGIDSSRIKSCVNEIESIVNSRTALVQQFVPKDTTNYEQNIQNYTKIEHNF